MRAPVAAVLAASLAVLPGVTRAAEPAPPWLRSGPHAVYDGRTDDLVTGGLGTAGMLGAPPGYADPLRPTAAELRRAYSRGSVGQGFGRLFGPNVDQATGAALPDDGRIAGEEWLAYADEGEGRQNVAMLLQVPRDLSTERRCLVAIPVAGSASLYRDVVDFGHWGLRRGLDRQGPRQRLPHAGAGHGEPARRAAGAGGGGGAGHAFPRRPGRRGPAALPGGLATPGRLQGGALQAEPQGRVGRGRAARHPLRLLAARAARPGVHPRQHAGDRHRQLQRRRCGALRRRARRAGPAR